MDRDGAPSPSALPRLGYAWLAIPAGQASEAIGPLHRGRAARAAARWARILRRLLVAHVTGRAPDALCFRDARGEPPRLAGWHGAPSISQSHSARHVACCIGFGADVGIDLEEAERFSARPNACVALAQRFFSAAEAAYVAALPSPQRGPAFLRLWVLKEALLKAHGTGLRLPLRAVAFAPGDVAFGAHARAAGTLHFVPPQNAPAAARLQSAAALVATRRHGAVAAPWLALASVRPRRTEAWVAAVPFVATDHSAQLRQACLQWQKRFGLWSAT